jgi:hypothetical protein
MFSLTHEDRCRETYTQKQTWSYTNSYIEHVCNTGNSLGNSGKRFHTTLQCNAVIQNFSQSLNTPFFPCVCMVIYLLNTVQVQWPVSLDFPSTWPIPIHHLNSLSFAKSFLYTRENFPLLGKGKFVNPKLLHFSSCTIITHGTCSPILLEVFEDQKLCYCIDLQNYDIHQNTDWVLLIQNSGNQKCFRLQTFSDFRIFA